MASNPVVAGLLMLGCDGENGNDGVSFHIPITLLVVEPSSNLAPVAGLLAVVAGLVVPPCPVVR